MNKKSLIKINTKSRQRLLGSYQSSFKGSWITFADIRPYVAGDPYHRIDRKTSAKKGEWYLKEFEEERLLSILIVLDIGHDVSFQTSSASKVDYMRNISQLISQAAQEAGDKVGYLVYDAAIKRYQKPARSIKHLQHLDNLLRQSPVHTKSAPWLAADYLAHQHVKHHLILRISDQLVTAVQKSIHGLARTNDVIRIHLFDPFEVAGRKEDMNNTALLLGDEQTTMPTYLDATTTTTYQKNFEKALHQTDRLLRGRNITTHTLQTNQELLTQLILLFHKHKQYKQRH